MQGGDDSTANAYLRYQETAASRLRYTLAQMNMAQLHDLARRLTVLDAAGGNGLNTEFLARAEHRITLDDVDPQMLAQARDRLDRLGVLSRCVLVQGRLEEVAEALRGRQFDLIVCHHALEYLSNVPAVFQAFHRLSGMGGELSVITLNPVSEVIRSIVFQHDPESARARLKDLRYDAKWFGQATLYPMDELVSWAAQAGWTLYGYRGIRVLADYFPQSQMTVAKEAELLRLEEELGGLEPFRRFGRYLQFAFKR